MQTQLFPQKESAPKKGDEPKSIKEQLEELTDFARDLTARLNGLDPAMFKPSQKPSSDYPEIEFHLNGGAARELLKRKQKD